MSEKFLIPASFADPLRELAAKDHAASLRMLWGVPADEAMRRGREFVAAWEAAGCPSLGEADES